MGILSIQPGGQQKENWRRGYWRFAGRVSFLRARTPFFLTRLRLRLETAYRRLMTAYRRRKRGARI